MDISLLELGKNLGDVRLANFQNFSDFGSHHSSFHCWTNSARKGLDDLTEKQLLHLNRWGSLVAEQQLL